MKVEHQTGGKLRMDIHYAHVPVSYSVEENFEGYFQEHDDLALAQPRHEQETVYQSLRRNAQVDMARSSNTTPGGRPVDIQQRHENSTQTVNAEFQLAMDEAYARELQELENEISYTFLNGTCVTGTDVTRAESSSSSGQENSARNASTQIAVEDDVDPDNMNYEVCDLLYELQEQR